LLFDKFADFIDTFLKVRKTSDLLVKMAQKESNKLKREQALIQVKSHYKERFNF